MAAPLRRLGSELHRSESASLKRVPTFTGTKLNLKSAVDKEKELYAKKARGSDSDSDESHESAEAANFGTAGTCGWGMFEVPPFSEALSHTSFFIFSGENKARILIYNTTKHPIFETIVILLIVSNCIFLAMDQPLQPTPAWRNYVDYFYIGAFSAEMLLKWFSLGVFAHPGSYIRNPWNVLDFIIVLLSYIGLLPQVGNLTAFRVLRVLRPLRSMNAIRGLQALVVGLMASMKGLVHVGILTFFVILVFAILGVQTMGGQFQFQCYNNATGWTGKPCNYPAPLDSTIYWGFACTGEAEGECMAGPRPYYDLYHFDNTLSGMALLFTVMTFDNWGTALNQGQGSVGVIMFLFFFFYTIVASYFLPNLMLAVINDEFIKATEAAEAEHQAKLEKEQRLKQQHELRAFRDGVSGEVVDEDEEPSNDPYARLSEAEREVVMQTTQYKVWAAWHHFRDKLHQFTEGYPRIDSPFIEVLLEEKRIEMEARKAAIKAERQAKIDALKAQAGISAEAAARTRRTVVSEAEESDTTKKSSDETKEEEDEEDDDDDEEPPTPLFGKFIVVFILLNTALLASNFVGQPAWLTQTQQTGNLVLTCIFALEFVLRVTALGPWRYVQDAFNCLDGIVVIVSMVEVGLSGSSTASVFRALRLLRILKLLRNFPSLRQIIQVTLIALKDTAYLLMIVALFLFISALVGMQFFAGVVVDSRSHFDDFPHAFYTMFHVLTLDGWTVLSYEIMFRTNPASFIFFVVYIAMGFYVLISLFLSILLSSFDSLEVDPGEVQNENQITYQMFDMSVAQTIFGRGAATKEELAEAPWVDPALCFKLSAHMERERKRAWHFLNKNVVPVVATSATSEQLQVTQPDDEDSAYSVTPLTQHLEGSRARLLVIGETPQASPTESQLQPSHGSRSASRRNTQLENPLAVPTITEPTPHHESLLAVPAGGHGALRDDISEDPSRTLWNAWPVWRDGQLIMPTGPLNVDGSPDAAEPERGDGKDGTDLDGESAQSQQRRRSIEHTKKTVEELAKPKHLFEVDPRYTIAGIRKKGKPVPKASTAQPNSGVITLSSAPAAKEQQKKEDPTEIICPECGQEMTLPLPSAPLVRQTTRKELHKVQCHFVATRIAKTAVLNALCDIVEMYIGIKQPTKLKYVDPVVGQAWQVGFLLSETPESFCVPDGWRQLLDELEEERLILELRIGEEQLGRSLIAYALGNVPTEFKTNGGWALFIFGPRNPLRIAFSRLVQNPWFDRFILMLILLNTIAMAADDPLDDPNSERNIILNNFDITFTACFTAEMVSKMIAYGVVFHEGAYLRDPWNCMDCFIVTVSLLSLVLTGVNISVLKVFRTMRTLRPLRVVNRNRGLKMVVRTLLESVKGIANVALISLITYLIFGILGVQWFGGNFNHCTDTNVTRADECNGTFFNSNYNTTWNRNWVPDDRNFDNILNSMLTLFEISSGENWEPIMYRAIDTCDPNVAGNQTDCNVAYGLYFIVFFAVTGFFILNLFVGVVIHNFNEVKDKMDGSTFMTAEQKLWVSTQQLILNFRPQIALYPRRGSASAAFVNARILTRWWFDVIIGSLIMLNIVALAVDTSNNAPEQDYILTIANNFFTFVFVVEAMLKLYVFGHRYFLSGWNQFDFFLVVIGVVSFIITSLGTGIGINVSTLRVFRIFRILRILRLVRQAKKIKILLATIWYSLPSMANIGAFIILVDFMYGILGVQLFAKLQIESDMYVLDDKINNFTSLDFVLMMLYRFSTVTDWDMVMHDCMRQPPYCTGDGCGTAAAPLYFVSHIVITSFVITNLIIAIILDNFETTMKLDNSSLRVQDLNRFIEIWSEFDEDASMTMPTALFAKLLAQLQPPLGLTRVQSRRELLSTTSKYRIPEHGGIIHFIETLIPLARTVKLEEPGDDHLSLTDRDVREHETLWRLTFPNLGDLPTLRYRQTTVTVDQYYCSTYIGASFRTRVAQRHAHERRLAKVEQIMEYCDSNGIAYDTVPFLRKFLNYYVQVKVATGHEPSELPQGQFAVAPDHHVAGKKSIDRAIAVMTHRGMVPKKLLTNSLKLSQHGKPPRPTGRQTSSRSPDHPELPTSGPGSIMSEQRYKSAIQEAEAAEAARRARIIPLVRAVNRKRLSHEEDDDHHDDNNDRELTAVGPM